METGLNLFAFAEKFYMQNTSQKNLSFQVAHEQQKFDIIHMLQ